MTGRDRTRRGVRSAAIAGLAAAALAASLAGCFGRSGDPHRERFGPPGLAVPGLAARQCTYLEPEQLGTVDQMTRVDLPGNLALWGAGGEPTDSIVLSIRYDDDGELAWVRPVVATIPPDRVESLERILRASIAEEGAPGWGFRFRVGGDGRGADVRPSVLCPVRLAQFDPNQGRLFGTTQEMQEAYRVRGRRFDVQVTVDPIGRVLDVRLPQSSGSRAVDQGALDVARSATFHPQLHDGFGVTAVFTFPIRYGRRY